MPAADVLAIHGGTPVIEKPFPPYRSLGDEEIDAANRVLQTGVLSAFIGAPGPFFYGGPEVQALEREAAKRFGVKQIHAFFNSCCPCFIIQDRCTFVRQWLRD